MINTTVLALPCALAAVFVCMAAGAAVRGGRSDWPGADMLVGFGLLTGALSILAVTTRLPLSWLMAGLGIVSVAIALAIRRQWPGGRVTWIAALLLSPILIIAAAHYPAMWDDFWNWLPSAAYEYWHNSLPWPDLPHSLSIFPGYPQAMPLMIAAASLLGGQFLETAGPVINVLLLAGSSALFAEALAAALAREGRLQATEMPLGLIVGAVAITTLFNPGLDGTVVLSSYADCGTMVAVGALGLIGVEILARLAAADAADDAADAEGLIDVKGLAWRFGLVGAMLVNLKQANPVLLALVMIGLIAVALRDPALRTRQALLQLPRMLGPAIVLLVVWRWYVTGNLPHSDQAFRPFAEWNFDILRQTMPAIGNYIVGAPLFHSMMWLVTAAGIVCFFQAPGKASEARKLAVVCATVWLGYNAFLVIVYIGAMMISDASIAADYWRYTPHVALLGLYPLVMALAGARWPAWLTLRSAPLKLAVLTLVLCAVPLRGDFYNPPGRPWQRFLRAAAIDMRSAIPPGSKLLIVPYWSSTPFAVAARYNLWQLDRPETQIAAGIMWDDSDLGKITSRAARGELNYLLMQDGEGMMDRVTTRIGLPPLHRELVLFAWRRGRWERVKSWPIPPELVQRDSQNVL